MKRDSENEADCQTDPVSLLYLTPGAGGMFCGSCIRDNALAGALIKMGWEVSLQPLYTPIRAEGKDFSVDQVFMGGVNVYLQENIPLFRYLPRWMDRFFDNPRFLRWVTRNRMEVDPAALGKLTHSMLRGHQGRQRKEVDRLIEFMAKSNSHEAICLSNLLICGLVPRLKEELQVPIFVTLQGDDVFLNGLVEPWSTRVEAEIRDLVQHIDGFLSFSPDYFQQMAKRFAIPESKCHLIPLGIDCAPYLRIHRASTEKTSFGFFSRLSPEKGLGVAVDAFIAVAREVSDVSFEIAGWLSREDDEFFESCRKKVQAAGLDERFRWMIAPTEQEKLDWMRRVDCAVLPNQMLEPKGLAALEAMAAGIPVVVPQRGNFESWITESGGGWMIPTDGLSQEEQVARWSQSLLAILSSEASVVREKGERGRAWVQKHASVEAMARATGEVLSRTVERPGC